MRRWGSYSGLSRKYPSLSLTEERELISRAQKGETDIANEIVLMHLGFVIFRLNKKIMPEFLERYGQDFLSESIPVLYKQIQAYNLYYQDQHGNPKPVKFVSYIWKRIDGFIIDSIKKELKRERIEITVSDFLPTS